MLIQNETGLGGITQRRGESLMENALIEKAKHSLLEKGIATLVDVYGCEKVVRSEKDLKSCIRLAKNGVIDPIISVK